MSLWHLQGQQINEAACDLAREVADEGDALVAGGVSQTPTYLSGKSEDDVKAILKKQLEVFIKKDVDFLIAEVRLSRHKQHSSGTLVSERHCALVLTLFFVLPPPSILSMLRRLSGQFRC